MLIKKNLLFVITLFLISLTTASLSISPNPLDISQTINSESTQQITIKNNYPFTISDFEFSNLNEYGFNFPEIEINQNETQTIDFTINPSTSFHGQVTSLVSFKFLVELSDETETHEINISSLGFTPNYLIIKKGDSVIWKNNDDLSHTVTSGIFDYAISPNQTIQHTFNEIGTINYQDLNLFFGGTIEVVNQSTNEKAHNPNYDINWVLNLDLISHPTNLTIENSKETYTIEHNKFKTGLLTITNTGSEIAEIVHLSSNSNWITFNKNDFDIEPGEDQIWVEYTLLPFITSTNETNKSHELDLVIKATNTIEYTKRINVVIPYKEITSSIENDIGLMIWLDKFYCPKHPCSSFCDPESLECQGTNETIYRDVQIPLNLSAREFYESLRRQQRTEDALSRVTNDLQIMADKWGITIPQLLNMLNQSVGMQQENEKKTKRTWNATWIIGFFALAIGLTGGIIKIINKKSYRQYLSDGSFEYRK